MLDPISWFSMFNNEITDTIANFGVDCTIKGISTRYYGNPTAAASSGGTFTAGTYYWRANPVVGGVEEPLGKETRLAVTLNQKVTLTLPNLGVGITFNVYRSATRDFPSPAILATGIAAGNYVDTGGVASAGKPEEGGSNPYAAKNTTATKCLRDEAAVNEQWLQEGISPQDELILWFKPSEVVDEGDSIIIDGLTYTVTFAQTTFYVGTSAQVLEVHVKRERLQV